MCGVSLDDRLVTIRKPHRCAWDGEEIPAGEPAHYHAGIFEGRWDHWYMHPECEVAMSRYLTYWGECDGFDLYEHDRGDDGLDAPAPRAVGQARR